MLTAQTAEFSTKRPRLLSLSSVVRESVPSNSRRVGMGNFGPLVWSSSINEVCQTPWVIEISLSIWRFPQWNTCRLYHINLSFRHNLGQAHSWSFLAIGRFFFDDDYISISKSVDVVRLGNLGSFEGDCFRAYSYTLKYCSKTQNKEKPILRYLGPKVQDLLSIVNPISLTVQWETRWISQIFLVEWSLAVSPFHANKHNFISSIPLFFFNVFTFKQTELYYQSLL